MTKSYNIDKLGHVKLHFTPPHYATSIPTIQSILYFNMTFPILTDLSAARPIYSLCWHFQHMISANIKCSDELVLKVDIHSLRKGF